MVVGIFVDNIKSHNVLEDREEYLARPRPTINVTSNSLTFCGGSAGVEAPCPIFDRIAS